MDTLIEKLQVNKKYKLDLSVNPLEIIKQEGDVLARAFRYIVDNNISNDAPYHHLNHMLRVMAFCNEGCKYHRIEGKPRLNLLVAAIFHDFNHTQGKEDDSVNVEIAKKGIMEWYRKNALNHSNINIKKVLEIVAATQYPYVIEKEDLTLEQSIIRDADLMIALDHDWMGTIIIGLATELGVDSFKKMADGQHKFHSGIEMCSPWGKEVYNNQWDIVFNNLDTLRNVL
jgi:hypothetical protein